ncbi:MAG: hypothetical protein JNL40_04390 [Cyclobacteriaceae bacterium]|nr:hypothetical protein [Cyclobacteriaceae bacterium]
MILKTDIIPLRQEFYRSKSGHNLNWDYENICVWAAIGFFLGEDTFYKEQKVCLPGHAYELSSDRTVLSSTPWFSWHYQPRDISFNQSVDEFADILERLINIQVGSRKVILPLSGGLDSRTLASALLGRSDVHCYSYEFENGVVQETEFAKQVAEAGSFDFKKFVIPPSYLWGKMERMAAINQCYCEFTHARPLAVIDEAAALGDIFLLGHWGDVLFDGLHQQGEITDEQLVLLLKSKIVKKGGLELAKSLWQSWGLHGNFEEYLTSRISVLLKDISIGHPSAKLRAFKSSQWAPRWTAVNLQLFSSVKPMALPYFHEELCKFICTVPEEYLADRRIQIEYIKRKTPALARVPWQRFAPYSLYNHHRYHSLTDWPRRVVNKMVSEFDRASGRVEKIAMNWQLQFLGNGNEKKLEQFLDCPQLQSFIGKPVIDGFFHKFIAVDSRHYSHPVSMLVTLAAMFRYLKTPDNHEVNAVNSPVIR